MWGVATGDSQLKVWIHPHWPFKWTPTTTKQINEKYKTMSVHVLFVSPLHLVFPTYLPLLNASTHHCLPEDKLLIPLITTWAATRHVFLTTPSRLPQLSTNVRYSVWDPQRSYCQRSIANLSSVQKRHMAVTAVRSSVYLSVTNFINTFYSWLPGILKTLRNHSIFRQHIFSYKLC